MIQLYNFKIKKGFKNQNSVSLSMIFFTENMSLSYIVMSKYCNLSRKLRTICIDDMELIHYVLNRIFKIMIYSTVLYKMTSYIMYSRSFIIAIFFSTFQEFKDK